MQTSKHDAREKSLIKEFERQLRKKMKNVLRHMPPVSLTNSAEYGPPLFLAERMAEHGMQDVSPKL